VALNNVYRREDNSIFIGDIKAKAEPKNVRRLMGGDAHVSYAAPGHLLFVRDNNLMAQAFDTQRLEFKGEPFVVADHVGSALNRNTSDFSISANGVLAWRSSAPGARQLTWVDRKGKQIDGLDAREDYWGFGVRFSPEGNKIALSMTDASNPMENIWLWDLVRGSKSRFTFGTTGEQSSPVWSPDGRRIVFSLRERTDYSFYWKDTSGAGNEELLLKSAQFSLPTDWSRDGRFIIFEQADVNGKMHMWVLPMFGERKPAPVLQTEFDETNATFSPDGRWIAYNSNESGRFEVFVRPFTEGGQGITAGKWQVSTAGGALPRWRRDGKELFFETLDGKMMAVPVKAGSQFAAEIPVALFDMHEAGGFPYDVRADGQRFLIIRTLAEGSARPVNICLNWLAGMKK
jgi:dipeptidyl aminopeptidase/acylaminoacyl peptidase